MSDWNEEALQQLKELHAQGKSTSEIAKTLQRHPFAVLKYAKKLGLTIADNGALKPWGDEETDKLIRLVDKGATIERCAEVLGRTVKSIKMKCTRLHLNPNRKWNKAIDAQKVAPAKNGRGNWSKADCMELCRLRREGATLDKCIETFGRSYNDVTRQCARLGVLYLNAPPPALTRNQRDQCRKLRCGAQWSWEQLAEHFECTVQEVIDAFYDNYGFYNSNLPIIPQNKSHGGQYE